MVVFLLFVCLFVSVGVLYCLFHFLFFVFVLSFQVCMFIILEGVNPTWPRCLDASSDGLEGALHGGAINSMRCQPPFADRYHGVESWMSRPFLVFWRVRLLRTNQ